MFLCSNNNVAKTAVKFCHGKAELVANILWHQGFLLSIFSLRLPCNKYSFIEHMENVEQRTSSQFEKIAEIL